MQTSFWNKLSHFFEKVAFLKQIQKVKKPSLKEYLLSLCSFKNIFLKLFLFVVLAILVIGCGFGIEMWFINNNPDAIILNKGVGFSFGENFNSSIVYLLQSVPIVIAFLGFIFIPKWWMIPGMLMLFFGGLCNIVDRALDFNIFIDGSWESSKDAVVDYVPFVKTTINANDVWICIGVGFIVLGIIIWTVLMFINDKKDAQKATPSVNENELNTDKSLSHYLSEPQSYE